MNRPCLSLPAFGWSGPATWHCSAFRLRRHPGLAALLCFLAAWALAPAAFAQAPQSYPGNTIKAGAIPGADAGDGSGNTKTWYVGGPGVSVESSAPGGTAGWSVSLLNGVFTIGIPASAPAGSYTVSYCTSATFSNSDGVDTENYRGYHASFAVQALPPAKPAAGNPAFSWQGSVAGVNTGNGNKTTTLPLVGWTQRGGIPVAISLIHNSQSAIGSPAGTKWQMSYFTYLSDDGSGNKILRWDSGLTYTYKKQADGSYAPPIGILDTLTPGAGGTFTLTAPSKMVYAFGFAPGGANGNAYLSAITDLDGNTLTISHNTDTTIHSIVDNANRAVTLSYSGGRLSGVSDPLGRQWSFGYTGAGDLWYVIDPPVGNTYSYRAFAYDGGHDITQTQDHNNNQSYFGYNGDGSLAWARDPLGNQTGFAYDVNDTSTTSNTVITDPNGHTLTHTYSLSRLASVTDARNLTESYSYDFNNILTGKTDKRGNTWTYSSHFSNATSTSTTTEPVINGQQAVTSSTYDSLNKVTSSTDALGNKTTYGYSTDGHEDLLGTTVSSYSGAPTAFSATTSAGGYTSGLPTTFTDANGNPSSVAYDPNGWGYVVTATDGNNISTGASYNALGWKLSSTDGLGRVTRYTYDAWGRLTVVTAPDGTTTGTVYDANGNVLRVADADAYAAAPLYAVHCAGSAVGHFSGDAYYSGGSGTGTGGADASAVAGPAPAALYQTARIGTFTYTFPGLTPGQLYTLRLHFVEAGYNAPGQRLFNVAVNGGAALTNFDIFAAAGAKNKAYIQEFSIVANGSGQIVVAFTPGAADVPVCSGLEVLPFVHTVANNYDADDRLVSTISGTGNGNGDIVSYAYDGPNGYGSADVNGQTQKGLLSSKTDGNGHTTVYTYTARNEPYQTFYADGTGESIGTSPTNGYDPDGNVLSRVKADGKTISYAYDADNRLTDITYPTLPAVHFDFDADSRQTHMHDGNGDTYWHFDDGLHLTHLASSRGDVTYGYDAGSRRTSMTAVGVNPSYPYNSYVYGYDNGNRLLSLTNPFNEKTSFLYNNDGTVQKKTLADGAYTSYGYDPTNGQLTGLSFVYPGLGGSYSHAYTYTPAGTLASRSESDGGTNTFGYDGMGQLVSEVRSGPVPFVHSYTYDHNGNRLTQSVNGSLAQLFAYDAHDKLTGGAGSGESESYDANGNLLAQTVGGQATRYSWDDEDRLTGQTFPDGHTDSYGYTGLGMRLRKSDPTGNYWYMADGVSPASDVLTDGHSTFTPGISEVNSLGSRFYLPDGQGNSRGLLDGNQNATDGYNWDGFGNLVSRFGSNPTGFAWNVSAGYQSDGDSGLKLLGHRYYDSRTGRFISQDPAGDGDNWYAYADNDPMDEVDSMGLEPDWPGQPDNTGQIPGFNGTPTGYGDDGRPYFIPNGAGTVPNGSDPNTFNYDLDSYGYRGPNGTSGPAGANNLGLGGKVDNWVTFGTVTNAGTVAGEYDAGHASRRAAVGAGALAVAVIVATGLSRGEDAEAVAATRVEEGIYDVLLESGERYVGQSGNITRRLAQHVANGKFTAEEAARAIRTEVLGGKTAREIAEQLKIDSYGGIRNLLNRVNPIGDARRGLMGEGYVRP